MAITKLAGPTRISKAIGYLSELDRRAYRRMEARDPDLLREIEAAIKAGETPEQVYSNILKHTGNEAVAKWCRQAAAGAMMVLEETGTL